MELKAATLVAWLLPIGEFQSHLYGIERKPFHGRQDNPTGFQSHLYGIERQDMPNTAYPMGSFNRTFMELKAGMRLVPLRVERVSIAPLWN